MLYTIDTNDFPEVARRLVGLDFNPSGDYYVDRLKALAAEMLTVVRAVCFSNDELYDDLDERARTQLANDAFQQIISAQMWAVKAVTFGAQRQENQEEADAEDANERTYDFDDSEEIPF